jgi:hypothetical protein
LLYLKQNTKGGENMGGEIKIYAFKVPTVPPEMREKLAKALHQENPLPPRGIFFKRCPKCGRRVVAQKFSEFCVPFGMGSDFVYFECKCGWSFAKRKIWGILKA